MPPPSCPEPDSGLIPDGGPDAGDGGNPDSGSPTDAGPTGNPFLDGGFNFAFVTSVTVPPATLGGIDGGDRLCNALAADAGLPGHYIAWLSSVDGGSALQRIPANVRGWIRPDGLPVFDRVSDVWGPQHKMFYPIKVTERGTVLDGYDLVATGSNSIGTADYTCGDWTTTSSQYTPWVSAGLPSAAWPRFMFSQLPSCTDALHYYCLEIDQDTPLPAPSAQGHRIAFTTLNTYPANLGVTGFDSACQSEATNSGLTGNFLALVGTSTRSPLSRFDAGTEPWARPDGVLLEPKAIDLWSSYTIMAPLIQTAAGVYLTYPPQTWSGAFALTSPAANTETCADWSMNDAGVYVRASSPSDSDLNWFGQDRYWTCDQHNALYCFQQ